MWSHVVDEKGRERVAVFYKAAFYDRRAAMTIMSRYQSGVEYEDESLRSKGRMRGYFKGDGRTIWTGDWVAKTEWDGYDEAQQEANAWGKANFPTDLIEQWAQD